MNTAQTIENKNVPIAAASTTMTGGEMVMQALLAENVELIFGYPGGAIMPIYDALHDYTDRMKHILVRHEQGAIHAAQGYARASGKTGVVLATSGPGATNLYVLQARYLPTSWVPMPFRKWMSSI